jgi:hypothetical protein
VPTIRVGRWRLVIIPRDHHPPHVHARQGTGRAPEVVIEFNLDTTLSIREFDDGLSRSDIRQVVEIVDAHVAELIELWERYC